MSFFFSFFFSPHSSKRTVGAIDESEWIFNGSESLGQAGARDDKLREIKQRRGEWEKEVAQWGVAQTRGGEEDMSSDADRSSPYISDQLELPSSLKHLTGRIAAPA